MIYCRIKIWELDESNNWNVEDDWKVRFLFYFNEYTLST